MIRPLPLPLTVNASAPKMASQIRLEATMSTETKHRNDSGSMFRAIATDIHFWIPIGVLLGGLLLLDKLR
jgi:hypothetical protein